MVSNSFMKSYSFFSIIIMDYILELFLPKFASSTYHQVSSSAVNQQIGNNCFINQYILIITYVNQELNWLT